MQFSLLKKYISRISKFTSCKNMLLNVIIVIVEKLKAILKKKHIIGKD